MKMLSSVHFRSRKDNLRYYLLDKNVLYEIAMYVAVPDTK